MLKQRKLRQSAAREMGLSKEHLDGQDYEKFFHSVNRCRHSAERSYLMRASEDARADRRRSACCGRTIRQRVTRGLNAHGGADFSPSWNAIRGMRVVEEM